MEIFIACILFADDMALMAPTRVSLQQLLDICARYCAKFCLNFNVKKSKIMVFGKLSKSVDSVAPLTVNGRILEFVDKWKYLGFLIVSGPRLRFSAQYELKKFFRAANSVLNVLRKPKPDVLLHLLYANCVPIITYGCEVKSYLSKDMGDCNVAINNAVRRIFSYKKWQSIRHLREMFGYKPIEVTFAIARKKFDSCLSTHENSVLKHLFTLINAAQ